MFPPEILALIAVTFLIAGTVKGLVGLGLPTVVLALLSSGIGLREAIALTLVPALVMNIWQAFAGGELVHILRRFWAWLIAICVGIWFGTSVLAGADVSVLTGLLGVLLVIYSVFSLATPQLPAPGQRERWLSPIFDQRMVGRRRGYDTARKTNHQQSPFPRNQSPCDVKMIAADRVIDNVDTSTIG